LILSVASLWEMQIKRQLGKLTLRLPLTEIVAHQRGTNGLQILSVERQHVISLDDLPPVHRDPFDRILAAQSRSEGLGFVSSDPVFQQYPVNLIW
jgi:PIN domain nuclease of toxin-antitoxin system